MFIAFEMRSRSVGALAAWKYSRVILVGEADRFTELAAVVESRHESDTFL